MKKLFKKGDIVKFTNNVKDGHCDFYDIDRSYINEEFIVVENYENSILVKRRNGELMYDGNEDVDDLIECCEYGKGWDKWFELSNKLLNKKINYKFLNDK